jgi:alkanesulfonate monooxygenase SsuD/methylene tetrahydromethanopterin reductase-like flavin-dependent oxidoreductase (luciferase family)
MEAAMKDYGHDLLFGSFVTPSVSDAERVLDHVVRADRAGLDLVTFQDHPYQPALLDTWTLLAYAAARTERVRLAGNVLNLPLRPPAVLARAVASLDILSGGRVELGLGAGGFWDGIAAMGGRRLDAPDSVDSLREAIAIIRDLWDTDRTGIVRHEGPHHTVVGAKRGPRPAHDIAIWVGAYKRRMLELTGQVADGWLPSVEYLARGADSLPEMNARIDDAAAAAGRAPTDVRRLLNVMQASLEPTSRGLLRGPAEQWIDQLTELALVHGISAFLVGGDDPTVAERLATEIAPAVRELVARERAA